MSDTTTETVPPAARELHRSRSDRMVAGVCGGLGRYFDLNPAFFRVGFVVLALLGGSGILIYIAAVLVMPDEGHRESIAAEALRDHRDRPWALVGLTLIAVAAVALLSHATLWPHTGGAWVLVLAAGGLILWSQRRERPPAVAASPAEPYVPAPAAPRPFGLGVPTLGVLVACAGVLGLLDARGVDVHWDLALAVAAIATGAAVVVGAILRLRVAGLAVLALALGLTAIAVTSVDIRLEGGFGDRTFHPASVADLDREYRLSIGDLRVDLSDLELQGTTHVDASVGIGQLTVIVPPDARVRIESDVSVGEVRLLGRELDGSDVHTTLVDGSGEELVLHAEVGLGELDVRRAVR